MSDNYVALLGTKGGPSVRPKSSMPTSNLFVMNGQHVVVDCALGVTRGLVDQGMNLKNLSTIFISHLHSDHYLELGPLVHTAWCSGLTTMVDIYGPAGLQDYWDGFVLSMKADIDLRIDDDGRDDLRDFVRVHVIDEGVVLERDGLTISALRTEHPPLIDCFAFSFKTAKHHAVFSGDTAPIKVLEDFARGADLLIHEAMLESALPSLLKRIGNGSDKLMAHWLRSHTFAHDAAKTAAKADVKRLALSHLIPSDDPTYGPKDWQEACAGHWDGELIVGHDGVKIEL
ncbi:MBL fold metallo-hydrolase [Ascidiaceihabitans sp.]|nr:MBL fold metallo-hydrolase [Ascidiaceihabitans sp.]|tara:strand:- start:2722 stop:3579 length:858 start_codon:yes stop_codon:yes gene_type:complete